jgi:peroxiredoxin
MGMDALVVDLSKRYYLTGDAYWADQETIKKIRENLYFMENNLLGMTAPELKLESIDSLQSFSLHQVKAKITILLIYEPGCSHCQEYVPALHKEVYEPYKNKGLAVYAVYSMSNWGEWDKFVNEHGLSDWINVWDPTHQSGFKVIYDARKTPAVYVLDKDKKIIAKKVSVEQLKQIMELELGNPE